jgi:type II secretory pathway predicted ATPase ExeA
MYEAFYGLRKPPFSNVPDPAFLFLSPQHQRALSVLRYALMVRAGFCVVTGDVGAGKTTLVRSLLKNIGQDVEIGLVSNTQCDSFEEFLKWVLLAFDLDYRGKDKVELYDTLVSYLIERYKAGRPVTLIIDEAQHLGTEYLEQLRMLSNVNTEKGQILQTILVGQPELWDLLRRPEMQQFAQRISYDYYLSPLENADLVRDYIQHRLVQAGGSAEVFGPDTFALVYEASRGVPRLINLVCDTALVYGFGEEQATFGARLIEQVIADKERSLSPLGVQEEVADDAGDDSDPPPMQPSPRKAPRLSTIERAASRLRKT